MTTVSGYIPGPYDGVSQTDPTVRLAGSCEVMEDCLAIIPGGVQKRPPLDYIVRLIRPTADPIPADPSARLEYIDRGGVLDLALLLNREAGAVKAYLFFKATWDPLALTVSAAAQTYLNTNSPVPSRDFSVATIEDTTFVANRLVPVANLGTTAAARPFEALIWVKTAGYARKTVVTVAAPTIPVTVTASFGTHSGSNSNDPNAIGTDKTAKALFDGTNPAIGNCDPNPNPLNALAGSGFTVVLDGSLIYLSHPTQDFTVTIADDQGGTAVTAIKGSVQRFSDLPQIAHDGFVARVAQEAAGGNSDYYVQFQAASASTVGIWKEVVAPGAALGVDPTTMPLRLYFTGGAWHLDTAPFTGRTTGTAALSPDPAFVGEPILSVDWLAGRLALLSSGDYTLSASDNPYKFYTTTLAASLASDPVGFLPPFKGKKRFSQATSFQDSTVLVGNLGQALVTVGQVTALGTSASDRIKRIASAAMTDQVPIQACGNKVYWAAPRGGYLQISELDTDRISGQTTPTDASPQVPRYITADVDRAATWETEYMTVYGVSNSPRAYVHVFRNDDKNQRVQNAYEGWNFPLPIGGMFAVDHTYYFALVDLQGFFAMCSMDVSPEVVPTGCTIQTYADIRFKETLLVSTDYDAIHGQTTFTLPIIAMAGLNAVVRGAGGFNGFPEGYALPVVDLTGTTLTVTGDWRFAPLFFGYTYNSRFTPTTFYKRGQDGNPELNGRLTIKSLKINLRPGSYVRVRVNVRGRPEQIPFAGIVGGDAPGSVPTAADIVELHVPIAGRNVDTTISIESDIYLGFKILGMEWSGTWTPRASRVT